MKPLSRRCNWRRTNGHSKQSESEAAGGVERKSSTSQGGAKGSSREIGNRGELVPMSLELCEVRSATQRDLMYLCIARIKVTFCLTSERKLSSKCTASSIVSFERDGHQLHRCSTTHRLLRVFSSSPTLPCGSSIRAQFAGSQFALLAVTVRPPPVASAAQWLHCFFRCYNAANAAEVSFV